MANKNVANASNFLAEEEEKGNVELSLCRQDGLPYTRLGYILGRATASGRDETLFDGSRFMSEEDIKDLQALKESNAYLDALGRRGKPVAISVYQAKIVVALASALSREIGRGGQVDKKIEDLGRGAVTRIVNVTDLSKYIFNSARKRYKEEIIEALFNLSRIYQYQLLGTGEDRAIIIRPLISIDGAVIDLSPEKRNDLDAISVTFGVAFFQELDNRFAKVSPKTFEVWSKQGRGTDLYSNLQFYLISQQFNHEREANRVEKEIRAEEKRNKKLSREELDEEIAKARRKKMTLELNVEFIKMMTRTDYDSKRSYKARFYKDLENAVEGYEELGLIEDCKIVKGAKGQEKVVFVYSENYCKAIESNEEEEVPILKKPTRNRTGF